MTVRFSCSGARSYSIDSQPHDGTLGSIDQSSGTVQYTPSPGFTGFDQFSYYGNNDGGPGNVAYADIDVTPPPSCRGFSFSAPQNQSAQLQLVCANRDPASRGLTYSIVSNPAHGALSSLDPARGTVTYTPNAGYAGPDAFTYAASNDAGSSSGSPVSARLIAPSDGAVAWGSNAFGALGDGTARGPSTCPGRGNSVRRTCSRTPVAVHGLGAVTSIAAGTSHSLALLPNGTVEAWGRNDTGQLGDHSTTNSASPVPVAGLSSVRAIAAGGDHSLALLSNGTVVAWGAGRLGQLGDGLAAGPDSCSGAVLSCSTTPVTVTQADGAALSGVVAIAAGGEHSLALLSNGTLVAWGANDNGQLGTSASDNCNGVACSTTPVSVTLNGGLLGPLFGVRAVAAGGRHSVALLEDGTVRVWGYNSSGQVGDGMSGGDSDTYVQADLPGGASAIGPGAAANHTLAVLGDTSVHAWGDNSSGQVGDRCPPGPSCPTPTPEIGVNGATAVAAGGRFSMALSSNGTVRMWGDNLYGELAGSTRAGRSVYPLEVPGLSGVTAIAAGNLHAVALVSPSNRFHLVGQARCSALCRVITLGLRLPGPGLIAVSQAPALGHGLLSAHKKRVRALLKPATVRVKKARTVKLKLKLTAAGRRALNHSRKLHLKVVITYTPTGGEPAHKLITVTFKGPPGQG